MYINYNRQKPYIIICTMVLNFYSKIFMRVTPSALIWRTAECENEKKESEEFRIALNTSKRKKTQFAHKWEYHSSNALPTPSKSWPDMQPDLEEITSLEAEWRNCQRESYARAFANESNQLPGVSPCCDDILFTIATGLFAQEQGDSQRLAYKKKAGIILRVLAHRGHSDAMCSYGICLMEGRGGVSINSKEVVQWLRVAADEHKHVQATYELGGAYYLGDGVV
uniref:Uncharacterized protein n=1 Tax=Corethron hystrix TaxID=216773 RepID=A0A7S1BWA8_9STRA|mmetsp:Transcript_41903/g.98210  ORF Transcript_41903/g.98210 Transcript_41903/m.98210 type:complete len:224 (+) Transcript_41903:302-973(+)